MELKQEEMKITHIGFHCIFFLRYVYCGLLFGRYYSLYEHVVSFILYSSNWLLSNAISPLFSCILSNLLINYDKRYFSRHNMNKPTLFDVKAKFQSKYIMILYIKVYASKHFSRGHIIQYIRE